MSDDSMWEAVEAAVLAEAKRRLDNLDCGRTQAVPYEEIKWKLRVTVERACQTEAPSAERQPPETEDAYRAHVLAKIERGIADAKAGRIVQHAEVLAMIDALSWIEVSRSARGEIYRGK
ncbi:MAG: hypothetical protein KC457_03395 [Myxococcales bacterium]|nr:hypothetical protein [Myxococcales bacterium]